MVSFITKGYAQYKTELTVSLNEYTNELDIRQEFTYYNDSNYNLGVIYFNDWANAYSDKNTGLAKRFAQEFKKSLHLAKAGERGTTTIVSVVDDSYNGLEWSRTEGKDILKVTLGNILLPKTSTKIFITYKVKLPPNKYTPYGYNQSGGYYLKDWYLTPAVYDGKWHLYSNKNLEDL
ncbi:metalloprotease, partial [bacterium]|nr:metalloprotease [bacterium]